jgi:hypothetical protein
MVEFTCVAPVSCGGMSWARVQVAVKAKAAMLIT